MNTGTVKWFNSKKGFGFIKPDTGSGDVFFHYSHIQTSGFKSLEDGQRVEYELSERTERGESAVNIRRIDSQPGQALSQPPRQVARSHESSSRDADSASVGHGTLKWFDPKKDFGFIQGEGGQDGRDIFVHGSQLRHIKPESLLPGAGVRYCINKSAKGVAAENVEMV